MAKKKARKRKPKKVSTPRDAAGIRELAEDVRALADRIDSYADQMDRMKIDAIRPLTGNFYQAVERIRVFSAQHILAKLVAEAEKRGFDAHEVFRD